VITALGGLFTAYAGMAAARHRVQRNARSQCEEELAHLREEYEEVVKAAVNAAREAHGEATR
jgi:hypothetical protein